MEDQKKPQDYIKKLDAYYAQLYDKREKINTAKLDMCAKYDAEMQSLWVLMSAIEQCKVMQVDNLEDYVSPLFAILYGTHE